MPQIEITAANAFKRWDDETLNRYVNTELTWTGREGYLAWVKDWKAILEIRIAAVKKYRLLMQTRLAGIEEEDRSYAQSMRQRVRLQCFNLLRVRKAAKLRAGAERAQRLAAQTAAMTATSK